MNGSDPTRLALAPPSGHGWWSGLVVLAFIGIVAIAARLRQRRRTVRAAAAWQRLLTCAAAHPAAHLCVVEHVYQKARRGSKAIIVWTATGARQDTWFHAVRPLPGSTLLVAGSTGYGPHNRNPQVLYVHPSGILAAAPPGAHHAHTRAATATTVVTTARHTGVDPVPPTLLPGPARRALGNRPFRGNDLHS